MSNPLFPPLSKGGQDVGASLQKGGHGVEASLQKGDRVWAYKANKVPQLCLPCKREDGRANIYEPAKEGYILNCTLFFAEFKIRQNV